jgi:hypothetical protein
MDNIVKALKTKQGRHRLGHCMAAPIAHGLKIPLKCDNCAGKDSEVGCNDQPDQCYRPIGIALVWNEQEVKHTIL